MTVDSNKTLTFEMTWQTVQVISAALQEMPFRVASPILADIQRQVTAQFADNVVSIKADAQGSSS